MSVEAINHEPCTSNEVGEQGYELEGLGNNGGDGLVGCGVQTS